MTDPLTTNSTLDAKRESGEISRSTASPGGPSSLDASCSSSSSSSRSSSDWHGERVWDSALADVKSGALKLPNVRLPNVPDRCPAVLVKRIEYVFAVRQAGGEDRDIQLGCEWLAQAVGLHKTNVAMWLRRLVTAGSIKHRGEMQLYNGRKVRLYAVGDLEPRPVTVEVGAVYPADVALSEPQVRQTQEPGHGLGRAVASGDRAGTRSVAGMGSVVHAPDSTPASGPTEDDWANIWRHVSEEHQPHGTAAQPSLFDTASAPETMSAPIPARGHLG